MWGQCGAYDMDDDGIERVDSQRWDDSSSPLDVDVLKKLHQRKDNVYPCWNSGS